MPPPTTHSIPPSLPLTLIVATTPIRVASASATTSTPPSDQNATRLGIGLKGTLPWPRIKADMSFFARVTSRPPKQGTTNAIIMGRKTYDSVPKHLRPLAKRISVVITRDQTGSELEARKAKMAATAKAKAEAAAEAGQGQASGPAPAQSSAEEPATDAIVTPSLDDALEQLDTVYGAEGRLGKVFVIGGAEIYGASLRGRSEALMKRPVRIVMTHVVRKPVTESGEEGAEEPFECDTFFPVEKFTAENGWRSVSAEEVTEWVGEDVTGEWKREGDVEVQMVGYERLD
ncbi:unnamed protein product [Penicillium pancosmium]